MKTEYAPVRWAREFPELAEGYLGIRRCLQLMPCRGQALFMAAHLRYPPRKRIFLNRLGGRSRTSPRTPRRVAKRKQ